MADSERLSTGGDEARDPLKRREELDQLLQRIAAHIAEVEKSPAGQPTAESEADAADAAGGERSRGEAEMDFGPPSPYPIVEPDDWLVVPGGDAFERAMPRREQSGSEPPALRSAMTSAAAHIPLHPAVSQTPGALHDELAGESERSAGENDPDQRREPADQAHDPAAQTADEPWDNDTAEALTRSYEADAAVPPLRSMLNLMVQTGSSAGRGEARGAGRSIAPSQGEISHADIDAAQTRLFEAAKRVESMLDRLAPREVVEALGDRFETLENEVRRSGDQLARLDGIEHRLGELGAKLTDEQVLNLFGSLVPTADELTQFAEDAASRAAGRVLEAYARDTASAGRASSGAASSATSEQLAALGDLVGRFMDERRRNDAGTLEALETLQLAMQHVLDRIDAIDADAGPAKAVAIEHGEASRPDPTAQRARPEAPPALGEPQDQLEPPVGAALDPADGSGEMINLTANQMAGAPDLTAESYAMPAEGADDLERPVSGNSLGDRRYWSRQRADGVAAGHDRGPDASLDEMPPAMPASSPAGGHPVAESPVPSDRQAFIAMARRAAERAKMQADQPAKAKPGASAPASSRKGGAFALGASTGIVRPGVLLVAVAAVLLAGYWFLFGQKDALLRPSASAAVEERLSESVASATAIAPKAVVANAATAEDASAVRSSQPLAPTPPAGGQLASVAPVASETAGPGMAVSFSNSPATFDTVMRARERSRLADLSQRAAITAVRSNGVKDAAAPQAGYTSAIETASVGGDAPATSVAPVGTRARDARQLDLPPAATGPLSLRLAAAEGDAAAQLEIATRLAEGKGVRQNFAEAARWYERSADQGQPIAQYRLATLYERGMGVKADRQKAQTLYEKAAGQGNLKAMHNLAVISASPAAGSPDYITAARLFSRAAQYGLHDSQYNLGVLYESGLGVPKDHGAAYKWYALAARSGDTVAARRRDALISRLPSETIQAMDAQIASWQAASADEAANNAHAAGSGRKQGDARSQTARR